MANSLYLYVGQPEAGQALADLADQRGDYVYRPDSLMQALGMYVTYFPQVVIIDMAVDYAQQVFDHLRSVEADPLVVLTDNSFRSTSIHSLPRMTPAGALLEALDCLEQFGYVPNGVLHLA